MYMYMKGSVGDILSVNEHVNIGHIYMYMYMKGSVGDIFSQ